MRICPKCGSDLKIVDVGPDGYDVWGCEFCAYREDEEE